MCAHLWLKTGDQKEPIPGFRPLFPPKSAFLLGNHQFCPPASACFWILCEPKSKNSEPKSKFGSLKFFLVHIKSEKVNQNPKMVHLKMDRVRLKSGEIREKWREMQVSGGHWQVAAQKSRLVTG
jgi:hypothetical protein